MPFKRNAHSDFLRGKEIHHFEYPVAGCAVDFNDKPSDAFQDSSLSSICVSAGVAGEILFSLTNQIETLEQRINPIFVPSSLTSDGEKAPPCFIRNSLRTTPAGPLPPQ